MYPVVAPFLASYSQVQKRFGLARKLLAPLIATRRSATGKEYPEVLQWLVKSARGHETEADQIVKRILFLNMASISTSGSTVTNVLLDLCARPADMATLREEMQEAVKEHGGITLATLSSLKKADSFVSESRIVNSLGLMTFNRELMVPLKLSNGITLPANTYISMTHHPMMNNPDFFRPLKYSMAYVSSSYANSQAKKMATSLHRLIQGFQIGVLGSLLARVGSGHQRRSNC